MASSSVTSAESPTGATAPAEFTACSPSSPRMSSTGEIAATSDAVNETDGGTLERGTRDGYFGDYELLKVLGDGGMGIVYKAIQLSLNSPVALKMIKASRFLSGDGDGNEGAPRTRKTTQFGEGLVCRGTGTSRA
jgi:serine/threonine protein kinase